MNENYIPPHVDELRCKRPISLLNTLSTQGVVDDWIQDDTEMEDLIY